MPFCEHCAQFWSPNSMPVTGMCPSCGRQIATPQEIQEAAEYKAPWHFKLMVVALVIYLGWRFVQLIMLVF